MTYQDLFYDVSGHVARITINRPEVLNAMRRQTIEELIDALHRCALDDSVGVVVLTGAGERSFCSGGDVKWEADGGIEENYDRYLDFHSALRNCLKPVIARVNGYAIGGGHHLAYFCDLTIAADHAVFGQNGPRVGSPIDGFVVSYLVRVVGAKRAREMWYLCRRYSAAQALEWGLVNAVVPMSELDAEVDRWCQELLAISPTCLKILKASFEREYEYLRDQPFSIQRLVAPKFLLSEEIREGQQAFLEKRQPDFQRFLAPSPDEARATEPAPTVDHR